MSEQTQYFTICEDDGDFIHLMDNKLNSTYFIDENGESYSVKVSEQTSFTVLVSNEVSDLQNLTYTNIMTLTGVCLDENSNIVQNGEINSIILGQVEGVNLVIFAFKETIGEFAGDFLAIAITLFAFSTIVGWSLYGQKATEYLFGLKAKKIYCLLFITTVFVGAIMQLTLVWEISDTLNGLMSLPNLIGVLALSTEVIILTKNYLRRKKGEDIEPIFSVYEDIQEQNLIEYYEQNFH